MTDPQVLLANAKCYICLGITLAEALQLALLDSIASGGSGGGGGGGAVVNFESALFPITAAPWPSAFGPFPYLRLAHGLGRVPRFYRAVWRCISDEANWGLVVGQEILVDSLYQIDDDLTGAPLIHPLQLWADANFLYACPRELTLMTGNEAQFVTETGLGDTGGGFDIPASLGNFAVKLYAQA